MSGFGSEMAKPIWDARAVCLNGVPIGTTSVQIETWQAPRPENSLGPLYLHAVTFILIRESE